MPVIIKRKSPVDRPIQRIEIISSWGVPTTFVFEHREGGIYQANPVLYQSDWNNEMGPKAAQALGEALIQWVKENQ